MTLKQTCSDERMRLLGTWGCLLIELYYIIRGVHPFSLQKLSDLVHGMVSEDLSGYKSNLFFRHKRCLTKTTMYS